MFFPFLFLDYVKAVENFTNNFTVMNSHSGHSRMKITCFEIGRKHSIKIILTVKIGVSVRSASTHLIVTVQKT